ncbi:MAG: 5-oxoprolinase subunit PxpA [Blastomonas sp.]
MRTTIDLNADLGEEPEESARDMALMRHVSSCNIACSGHAGDDGSMRQMLLAARDAGIAAGAHPSYPDRANFGRKSMDIGTERLVENLVEQVSRLKRIADAVGVRIGHIKPHGALYNDLADNGELAEKVAGAFVEFFPEMALVGLAGGAMEAAAKRLGHEWIAEAFIDRAYQANGRLVPRSQPGAVLCNDQARIAQALAIAQHGRLMTAHRDEIMIAADSLCIHSDSPGALQTARNIRTALDEAGISVAAPRLA